MLSLGKLTFKDDVKPYNVIFLSVSIGHPNSSMAMESAAWHRLDQKTDEILASIPSDSFSFVHPNTVTKLLIVPNFL